MVSPLVVQRRTKNSAGHQSGGRQPSSAHTVFVYSRTNIYTRIKTLSAYIYTFMYAEWIAFHEHKTWNSWMNRNSKHAYISFQIIPRVSYIHYMLYNTFQNNECISDQSIFALRKYNTFTNYFQKKQIIPGLLWCLERAAQHTKITCWILSRRLNMNLIYILGKIGI